MVYTPEELAGMTELAQKLAQEQQAALDNWFAYHPPVDDTQRQAYEQIRAAGKVFAETVVKLTPVSADQSAALRHIRDAVMTANAALACEGR